MHSGIKISIFGTQPSHLWNTTCWPCGEEPDYNTGGSIVGLLGKIPVTLGWDKIFYLMGANTFSQKFCPKQWESAATEDIQNSGNLGIYLFIAANNNLSIRMRYGPFSLICTSSAALFASSWLSTLKWHSCLDSTLLSAVTLIETEQIM